ncbi:hypothetical protein AKG07_09845 [Microbacterium sp. CGR1]|nr:hypothetical protein AKG07_09845 [Microbacterium sp. CGR1]
MPWPRSRANRPTTRAAGAATTPSDGPSTAAPTASPRSWSCWRPIAPTSTPNAARCSRPQMRWGRASTTTGTRSSPSGTSLIT